jgi:phosphoglycolate phosphatase
MQTVIWDWNGTLLDDIDFCVSAINSLLKKRNLAQLNRELYKDVFTFPVQNYYEAIGFNFEKEQFAIPANEFMKIYTSGVNQCKLHPSSVEILSYFKTCDVRQFVLSAMKQELLEETLKHQSIFNFFEGVFGVNNNYGISKIERGKQLISELKLNRNETWIIGDTIHDFEVAKELRIKCILIADGHQSEERLQNTGTTVIRKLDDLKNNSLICR